MVQGHADNKSLSYACIGRHGINYFVQLTKVNKMGEKEDKKYNFYTQTVNCVSVEKLLMTSVTHFLYKNINIHTCQLI